MTLTSSSAVRLIFHQGGARWPRLVMKAETSSEFVQTRGSPLKCSCPGPLPQMGRRHMGVTGGTDASLCCAVGVDRGEEVRLQSDTSLVFVQWHIGLLGLFIFLQGYRMATEVLKSAEYRGVTSYLFGIARAPLPPVGLGPLCSAAPPPPNNGKKGIKSEEKSDFIRILMVPWNTFQPLIPPPPIDLKSYTYGRYFGRSQGTEGETPPSPLPFNGAGRVTHNIRTYPTGREPIVFLRQLIAFPNLGTSWKVTGRLFNHGRCLYLFWCTYQHNFENPKTNR